MYSAKHKSGKSIDNVNTLLRIDPSMVGMIKVQVMEMFIECRKIKLPERIFEVRRTDMDEEMQQEAVNAARVALEISMESVEIAGYSKKRFDKLCLLGIALLDHISLG